MPELIEAYINNYDYFRTNDDEEISISIQIIVESVIESGGRKSYQSQFFIKTPAQENFYDNDMQRFLSDKMVALDRDKAQFCYLFCRSLRATRVVEAGTSFGVSTLYLAAAVRDNQVENGVVIGTEYEPKKVEIARANFKEAGLSEFIELREGDLRQTLQDVGGPVDFIAG